MPALPKSTALSAIAEILLQADQAARFQNPCKASRLQRFSSTISVNGLSSPHPAFYTSSSESITKPHACPVTPQMSKHAKALLLQYLDQNISFAAQCFDVADFPLPLDDKTRAFDAFLEATGTTFTNEWSLGDKVANHLLSAIRNQDRRNSTCEAELKAELHFSLILSITSPPHSQIRHLERAKQLCKKRCGKTFLLLERAEQHYANSISFPSSPPSPLSPATRFHNRLRSRRTSTSSLSSRQSTISSISSKSLATPPVLTSNSDDSSDSLPYGSFSVTAPARQSLRYVHSKSARPRGIPFFWTMRSTKVVPPTLSPPIEPEEGLPTICRTPVFESSSDYKEFIPRRMEPEKMARVPSRFSSTTTPHRPSPSRKSTPATLTPPTRTNSNSGMNSILAEVEKTSKFRMQSTCSKCTREGLDYPKCPRCNETWCSRECRVSGGKHSCGSPSISAQARG